MQSFIIAGARTPIGRYGGALAGARPDDLAALVVGEAVARAGVDPTDIDEVVFGAANAGTARVGHFPDAGGRQVAWQRLISAAKLRSFLRKSITRLPRAKGNS